MGTAVLFSPDGGKKELFAAIGKDIEALFSASSIVCCEKAFGAEHLPGATIVSHKHCDNYLANLEEMILALLEKKPELFVCVGGDGIASYLASFLLKHNAAVPILGVAAGTANVGPIAMCSPQMLHQANPNLWEETSVCAICAWIETEGKRQILGYGFNDVVVGDTFLSTINGKTVNISIVDMVQKKLKTQQIPSKDITTHEFSVFKNGCKVAYEKTHPGQIVVSPIVPSSFYGRAVTGALCLSAFSKLKAAVAFLDEPLVSVHAKPDLGVSSFFSCEHLLFGEDDTICFTGLSPHGHVAIDGNPFVLPHGQLWLGYCHNAAKILQL